jgi:hypothetical protein
MPFECAFAAADVDLRGDERISPEDADRQTATAREILNRLTEQPGVVLADEVGMGKTFVALAVAASVLRQESNDSRPIIVMLPRGLVPKWRRDWEYFRTACVSESSMLKLTRFAEVRSAADLLHALDTRASHRPHLVFASVGAFDAKLNDPWIKLAMIRLALGQSRLPKAQRRRAVRYATTLIKMRNDSKLTEALIDTLLRTGIDKWVALLKSASVLPAEAADPIPDVLRSNSEALDLTKAKEILRSQLPRAREVGSARAHADLVAAFTQACQEAYEQWLPHILWRSPLLILDEAHHAKNSGTKLARMFRTTAAPGAPTPAVAPRLFGKFDRMLLLTATPFQLGHDELVRVLRSMGSVSWAGNSKPSRTRDEFASAMGQLEEGLTANRQAAQALDKAWGRITTAHVRGRCTATTDEDIRSEKHVVEWFNATTATELQGTSDPHEAALARAYQRCVETRDQAAYNGKEPWAALRTWVIRHNRAGRIVVDEHTHASVPRRDMRTGRAIATPHDIPLDQSGLNFEANDSLPFLLAARAQGEMAGKRRTKALKFTEGLCSSFEAFHHTRQLGAAAIDDMASELAPISEAPYSPSLIPLEWYAENIAKYVPGNDLDDQRTLDHPKLRPVVARVVDLWERGEKALVFCYYRRTSEALRFHIERALDQRVDRLAMQQTGASSPAEGRRRFKRIVRRVGDKKSPFYRMLEERLRGVVYDSRWTGIQAAREEVLSVLMSYARSIPFLARVLSKGSGALFKGLGAADTNHKEIRIGLAAFEQALDGSALSLTSIATSFCAFASEIAERTTVNPIPNPEEGEGPRGSDQLAEYLHAIARHSQRASPEAGRRRTALAAQQPVRMVNGDTPQETRDLVMLAFNSPMFPEVLISSKVLGEGVDLHRYCRHVIHHDLDWNPSVLEQHTGRLDRIRSRAEVERKSIVVYQPFIAGSADERMFRVVKDRERWFQIVMGQRYEFDEGTAEDLAERIPLPVEISQKLVFDLSVHPSKQGSIA